MSYDNMKPTPPIIPIVGKRYNIKTKNGIKKLYLSYINNGYYYFVKDPKKINHSLALTGRGTVYNIKNIISEEE